MYRKKTIGGKKMPKGCFCVLLPLDSDYKILGYYIKNLNDTNFKIKGDLFLRLNLDHERNDYNFLKLKDFHIFSYIYKLVPQTLTKTQKRGQSSFQKMKNVIK